MDDDDDDVDGEDAPKVKTHFVKTKGEFTVEASLSIHPLRYSLSDNIRIQLVRKYTYS